VTCGFIEVSGMRRRGSLGGVLCEACCMDNGQFRENIEDLEPHVSQAPLAYQLLTTNDPKHYGNTIDVDNQSH